MHLLERATFAHLNLKPKKSYLDTLIHLFLVLYVEAIDICSMRINLEPR